MRALCNAASGIWLEISDEFLEKLRDDRAEGCVGIVSLGQGGMVGRALALRAGSYINYIAQAIHFIDTTQRFGIL